LREMILAKEDQGFSKSRSSNWTVIRSDKKLSWACLVESLSRATIYTFFQILRNHNKNKLF
jgi:hypothetical protein